MKTLIIGAGGIGSWLVGEIAKDLENGIIEPEHEFTIADDDLVELRNVKFQNFDISEIGTRKIDALVKSTSGLIRPYEDGRVIDKTDLEGYDLIVLCVDNHHTRKVVFEETTAPFIDLRADGRMVTAMVRKADYLSTINVDDKTDTSCQTKHDQERGWVQKGNKIAAMIGSQMLLNHLRGELNYQTIIRV